MYAVNLLLSLLKMELLWQKQINLFSTTKLSTIYSALCCICNISYVESQQSERQHFSGSLLEGKDTSSTKKAKY